MLNTKDKVYSELAKMIDLCFSFEIDSFQYKLCPKGDSMQQTLLLLTLTQVFLGCVSDSSGASNSPASVDYLTTEITIPRLLDQGGLYLFDEQAKTAVPSDPAIGEEATNISTFVPSTYSSIEMAFSENRYYPDEKVDVTFVISQTDTGFFEATIESGKINLTEKISYSCGAQTQACFINGTQIEGLISQNSLILTSAKGLFVTDTKREVFRRIISP